MIADAVAEALAGQRWRLMGARTQTEARAYFISTVRRELGITFVIAMARHRLQREPFVGMSPAAVRAMRDARGQAVRRHQAGGGTRPTRPVGVYDFYLSAPGPGGTWGDVGGQGVSAFECLPVRCPAACLSVSVRCLCWTSGT